jgi:hypothetical protein
MVLEKEEILDLCKRILQRYDIFGKALDGK